MGKGERSPVLTYQQRGEQIQTSRRVNLGVDMTASISQKALKHDDFNDICRIGKLINGLLEYHWQLRIRNKYVGPREHAAPA